jgi:hypothetical protein
MSPNLVSEQEIFFTSFEPKMKNRFLMYMDGLPSYIVRKIERPKITQEPKVLPHINVERYVKGKSKWGPINVTLYDPIVPSGAQAVMEWVRLHHESVTGRDGYADFYKKDITFVMLGPVGDKVEEWIGKGVQISEANFGEADWSVDDPAEINLVLQADYWILNY